MRKITDYFVPAEFSNRETVETRRAELIVRIVMLIGIFAPPFMAVYHWGLGATEAAVGVGVGMAAISMAPVVLRQTGNIRLAGHLFLTPAYLCLLWISFFTGGLLAPGMGWLLLIPILAVLVGGVGLGLGWLVVVLVTWSAVFGLESMGYDFGQNLYQEYAGGLRLVELLSLGGVIFGLVYLKDNLEKWLIDTVERKEHETRAVLETAPDGILTLGLDGTIQTANKAAERLFDITSKDLCGTSIREVVTDLPSEVLERDGQFRDSEEYLGQRNGDGFPIEIAFGMLEDETGNKERLVLVMRDVTERKQTEQSLRDARDEALEASRAKSTFLANMSHELRTPLNAVIGYSEMLLEEIDYLDKSNHEDAGVARQFAPDLQRIHSAGDHLLALINDILDLSKIEAGKMQTHVEFFDVQQLCQDVVDTVRPLASENNNDFQLDIDQDLEMMRSDATKVRQILFNLLSNACKFTQEGIVRMSVRGDEAEQEIVFVVEDSGIGMSDDEIEEVFEAFSQADSSTTREFGGTGLGLTITSHFCSILNGSIDVQSSAGEGTIFTVRLAAELNQEETSPSDDVADSDVEPASTTSDNVSEATVGDGEVVLVVDDDPTTRDLLGRMLKSEGFEVVTAASGSEGLLLAKRLEPAAITLDVMMPTMDGWTMLTKLKEDPQLAEIPVVMVSMISEQRRGLALGADDYLVKPVHKPELVKTLDSYRLKTEESTKILVAEDDEPTRTLMRRILEGQGGSVTVAETGIEALEAIDETTPDLILLDLMMPEMDGFEFLHNLREDDTYSDIPVVVVTAKELTDDEKQKLNTQVGDIIAKGQKRESLLEEIRQMVVDFTGSDRGQPEEKSDTADQ